MSLMRRAVLTVADNPMVTRVFHSSVVKRNLVDRFVAGETLDAALAATRDLAANGITTTLDLLGENVTSADAAQSAVGSYTGILRAMRAEGLEPNISVKLTMLGLEDLASIRPRHRRDRIRREQARLEEARLAIELEQRRLKMVVREAQMLQHVAREEPLTSEVMNRQHGRRTRIAEALAKQIRDHRRRPIVRVHELERRTRERALADELDHREREDRSASRVERIEIGAAFTRAKPHVEEAGYVQQNKLDA